MENQSTKKYNTTVLAIILLLIAFFAYFNSLNGKYIADDEVLITNNVEFLSNLANIPKSFKLHYQVKEPGESVYFRPVILCSYIVDYQLFGLDPRGSHLRNTMLHALNCLLIFWLLIIIFRRKVLAFFAALVFAIHPVHLSAVAWVSGRTELFSTFFILLTLILMLLHAQRGKLIWFLVSFVTFYLALLSRETSIIAVFFIPLVLLAKEKLDTDFEIEPLVILRYFLTYAVVLAFYIFHRYAILGPVGTRTLANAIPFLTRLGSSFSLGLFYLGKIIFPYSFSFYPAIELSVPFFSLSNLAGLVVLLILLGLSILFYNKRHLVSFSIAFFLLSIFPFVNIISAPGVGREHILYLPSLAFCLVAGFLLYRLYMARRTWWKYVLSVLVVIVLGYAVLVTNQRIQLFTSSLKFWEYTVEITPELATPHNTLGAVYLERGEHNQAQKEFQKALRLEPENWVSYYNLGLLYAELNQYDKTIHYWETTRRYFADLKLLENLGLTYFTIKEFEKAIEVWEEALRLDPRNRMIRYYIKSTHELIEFEDSVYAAQQDSS